MSWEDSKQTIKCFLFIFFFRLHNKLNHIIFLQFFLSTQYTFQQNYQIYQQNGCLKFKNSIQNSYIPSNFTFIRAQSSMRVCRNHSQKHQIKSEDQEFNNSNNLFHIKSNHSQVQAAKIRKKLNNLSQHSQLRFIHLQDEQIIGWEQSQNHAISKKSYFKQVRPQQSKKKSLKVKPIDFRNQTKTHNNDTIGYLKHMLLMLKSQREELNLETAVLKEQNKDHLIRKPKIFKKICADRQRQGHNLTKKQCEQTLSMDKENQYSDAQIINQLINGMSRLPKIDDSKKTISRQRTRKNSKFTLDKLIV